MRPQVVILPIGNGSEEKLLEAAEKGENTIGVVLLGEVSCNSMERDGHVLEVYYSKSKNQEKQVSDFDFFGCAISLIYPTLI